MQEETYVIDDDGLKIYADSYDAGDIITVDTFGTFGGHSCTYECRTTSDGVKYWKQLKDEKLYDSR